MDLGDLVLLLAAGLAAGTLNAVAGGGSLVTYPALLATGLPPVAANVTNSIAVFPGYLAAVAGSRLDLAGQGRRVRRLLPTAAVGSAVGSAVLLLSPPGAFEAVVPFLVLGATATLAFQDRLRQLARLPADRAAPGSPARSEVSLHVLVGLGAVYGGYFGAALGVLLVALFALALAEPMARVSALKNLASAVVGLVTVVIFALYGPVEWVAVAVLAPATIVGGYTGARLARRLPHAVWKATIVVFGTTVGIVLLLRQYA